MKSEKKEAPNIEIVTCRITVDADENLQEAYSTVISFNGKAAYLCYSHTNMRKSINSLITLSLDFRN